MANDLTAWLYGTPLLTLTPTNNFRVSFKWEPLGIERWGLGSRILSISLPLGSPTGPRDDRALEYFSNLLPDGPTLTAMASLAGVSELDTFGLLSTFGSECAGAVVLLSDGQSPSDPSTWGAEELSLLDIAAAIDNLSVAPFGASIEKGWTPSLAGFQGKILLGRSKSQQWTRPTNGAPSTWILKPDIEYRIAENEATCLRLAAASGLPVPDVELLEINGHRVVAIRRYDRDDSTEPVTRIHQEDGCQATATPSQQKYEYSGGPSLKDLAVILKDYGDADSLRELLRRVTFNAAIGNADAHAKNFSILHELNNPSIVLAPVYDVISTIALEPRLNALGALIDASTQMGQSVNGIDDIRRVSAADLVTEATTWGIRRKFAQEVVVESLDTTEGSLQSVEGDESTLTTIDEQLKRLRK